LINHTVIICTIKHISSSVFEKKSGFMMNFLIFQANGANLLNLVGQKLPKNPKKHPNLLNLTVFQTAIPPVPFQQVSNEKERQSGEARNHKRRPGRPFEPPYACGTRNLPLAAAMFQYSLDCRDPGDGKAAGQSPCKKCLQNPGRHRSGGTGPVLRPSESK
jgi:hypothetical protein